MGVTRLAMPISSGKAEEEADSGAIGDASGVPAERASVFVG